MGVGGRSYYFQDMHFPSQIWEKNAPTLGMSCHRRQLRNVPFTPLCAKFQGPFVLNHPTTLTEVA